MPTDLLTLLRRDHADLQHDLTQLLDPQATAADLRLSLDGVRLGLTAHSEAEDIVLGRFEQLPALKVRIAHARAAHVTQEGTLAALVTTRPQTLAWRECAIYLRSLVGFHASDEEFSLIPALRAHVAHYARLAGAFATERLRQLGMLQPSAPIYLPDLGARQAC